jgi:hypothetical protein
LKIPIAELLLLTLEPTALINGPSRDTNVGAFDPPAGDDSTRMDPNPVDPVPSGKGFGPPRLTVEPDSWISGSVPELENVARCTSSRLNSDDTVLFPTLSNGPERCTAPGAMTAPPPESDTVKKSPPDRASGPALKVDPPLSWIKGEVVVLVSIPPSETKNPPQQAEPRPSDVVLNTLPFVAASNGPANDIVVGLLAERDPRTVNRRADVVAVELSNDSRALAVVSVTWELCAMKMKVNPLSVGSPFFSVAFCTARSGPDRVMVGDSPSPEPI